MVNLSMTKHHLALWESLWRGMSFSPIQSLSIALTNLQHRLVVKVCDSVVWQPSAPV